MVEFIRNCYILIMFSAVRFLQIQSHIWNLRVYRVNLILFRYLIPLLLQYDSTAEESDKTQAHGVGTSVQIAKNLHAVQASHSLSRLSGLDTSENPAPYNQVAADALRSLLTPKLASMLKDTLPKDLLSKLNSSLETPEVNRFWIFTFHVGQFYAAKH